MNKKKLDDYLIHITNSGIDYPMDDEKVYYDDKWGQKSPWGYKYPEEIADGYHALQRREIEDEYANLRRQQDKLKRREAKLNKRQAELAEQDRKLKLTPAKRMKEALALEASLVTERDKFEAEKQGHKTKVKDFRTEAKKVQAELDKAAELVEAECQKTIDKATKKLEAAGLKKTKELTAQDAQQKKLGKDLANEEKRLTQIRHELSDREANLVRRETAVRQAEVSGGGTSKPPSNGETRELEL